LQLGQKLRQSDFPFPQQQMVDLGEIVMAGGEQRTAGDRFHPQSPATINYHLRRLALDGHGTDETEIGPVQIAVGKGEHVHVDQSLVPGPRQHRRDSHQTQRREACLPADELHGFPETP
jgi:hypothetical protein